MSSTYRIPKKTQSDPSSKYYFHRRVWTLHSTPSTKSSSSECSWSATISVDAHSMRPLAGFRPEIVTQQSVVWARATDQERRTVFRYSHPKSIYKSNINCYADQLHPHHGSWWFWPTRAGSDADYDVTVLGCLGEKDGGENEPSEEARRVSVREKLQRFLGHTQEPPPYSP